ncbi:MAG: DUF3352 domain-containing protein [Chloroflexaceae bacterium]|nr:DUF3352 domain-containing protein [Chloroflexaceae bacterium]
MMQHTRIHKPQAMRTPWLALRLVGVLLFGAVVLLTSSSLLPVRAQSNERCFSETGFCIQGRFYSFWQQHGGLPVFGLPISAAETVLIEGQPRHVQWFERSRLEWHPEQEAPYDVLLGRLGGDMLQHQGRAWQAFPTSPTTVPVGCRFFAETGHSLCGDFLAAWQAHGLERDGQPGSSTAESLALFGLPLSEPVEETLSDGQTYTVQWFERTRFERHPQNDPSHRVLFGLLGRELMQPATAFEGPVIPDPQPSPAPTPTPAGPPPPPAQTPEPTEATPLETPPMPQPIANQPATIAGLLGGDILVYGQIASRPSTLPNAERLLAAYPWLFFDQSSPDNAITTNLGVSIDEDILPWIGDEMAFAFGGLGDRLTPEMLAETDDPSDVLRFGKFTVILPSRNAEAAWAFLNKQRQYRERQGEQFEVIDYQGIPIFAKSDSTDPDALYQAAFALVGDYVLFSNSVSQIRTIIDRPAGSDDAFLVNPRYQRLMHNVPADAAGMIFVDRLVLQSSFFASLVSATTGSTAVASQQLVPRNAMDSLGLSIALLPRGVRLDITTIFDMSLFDAATLARIEDMREPVSPDWLQLISDEAVALLTLRFPSDIAEQVETLLQQDPAAADALTEFEEMTSVDLQRDLLSWVGGQQAALVVFPEAATGLSGLPSSYLAITAADPVVAEAGISNMFDSIVSNSDLESLVTTETIGGVDWRAVQDPESPELALGYAFVGNEIVLAVGEIGMEQAATGQNNAIANDPNLLAVTGNLPVVNAGLFYLNIEGVLEDSDGSPELNPLRSLGAAALPGVDTTGLSRASLLLHLRAP